MKKVVTGYVPPGCGSSMTSVEAGPSNICLRWNCAVSQSGKALVRQTEHLQHLKIQAQRQWFCLNPHAWICLKHLKNKSSINDDLSNCKIKNALKKPRKWMEMASENPKYHFPSTASIKTEFGTPNKLLPKQKEIPSCKWSRKPRLVQS